MPEQSIQIRHAVTSRNERKELLALACEVDRAAWGEACRPHRRPGLQVAANLLSFVESFSAFLPGRLGRWLRGANLIASITRRFGWLRL